MDDKVDMHCDFCRDFFCAQPGPPFAISCRDVSDHSSIFNMREWLARENFHD